MFLALAIAFLAGLYMLGVWDTPSGPTDALLAQPQEMEQARADLYGAALSQWHETALRYRSANPTITGTVSATALAGYKPTAVQPVATVQAYISGGCIATWATGIPDGQSLQLIAYYAATRARAGLSGLVLPSTVQMQPVTVYTPPFFGASYTPAVPTVYSLPTGLVLPEKTPVIVSCS